MRTAAPPQQRSDVTQPRVGVIEGYLAVLILSVTAGKVKYNSITFNGSRKEAKAAASLRKRNKEVSRPCGMQTVRGSAGEGAGRCGERDDRVWWRRLARAVGSSGNGRRRRQPSQCQVHRWICSLLLRARKDDGDAAPGAPFLAREKEKWKHPSPKPSRKCGLRNTQQKDEQK